MWREFYVLIIIHITLFFIYSFELNWVTDLFLFYFRHRTKKPIDRGNAKKNPLKEFSKNDWTYLWVEHLFSF